MIDDAALAQGSRLSARSGVVHLALFAGLVGARFDDTGHEFTTMMQNNIVLDLNTVIDVILAELTEIAEGNIRTAVA
ncbi:MAG: hypothetical protein V4531_06895 [Actinomycetota bacterium]